MIHGSRNEWQGGMRIPCSDEIGGYDFVSKRIAWQMAQGRENEVSSNGISMNSSTHDSDRKDGEHKHK